MKTIVVTIFALSLMVLATVAGCSSPRRTFGNEDTGTIMRVDAGLPLPVDSGTIVRPDAFVPPRDAGTDVFTPPRDAGARVCASSCTSDSQCASSCPFTAGSASCCDLGTNTCYMAGGSVCPTPGEDAGTSMY